MRIQGLSGERLVLTHWLTSVPLVNAWVFNEQITKGQRSEGRVTELNRLSENVVFIESCWTIGLLIMYECVLGLQTERQCFFSAWCLRLDPKLLLWIKFSVFKS